MIIWLRRCTLKFFQVEKVIVQLETSSSELVCNVEHPTKYPLKHFGAHRGAERVEEAQMVTTRSMDEQQTTRELITQMQEQMQAQARAMQEQLQEMQRKHEEEIVMLRNEQARRVQSEQHSALLAQRDHTSNSGTRRDQKQSHHTNPNGNPKGNANLNGNTNGNTNPNGNPNDNRKRREPTPLQTIRPVGLLPFTAAIMQAPMPEKALPIFDKYDGSTDPDDHMRAFVNAMAFYSNSGLVLCRAFSLSLKGEALSWYNTLPPNTVDCFAIVQTLFGRQYASSSVQDSRRIGKYQARKRGNFEGLYEKVNDSFVSNNLPSCLRPGYFTEKLYARPPKTMEKLQKRVAEFIRRQQEVDVGGSGKDGKRPFDNNDKSRDLSPTFKFNHYISLSAPRAKVLEETLNAKLLKLQEKATAKNADEKKEPNQEVPLEEDLYTEVPNGHTEGRNRDEIMIAVVVETVCRNDRFVGVLIKQYYHVSLTLMYSALRPQLFNNSASKVFGHSTSQLSNCSVSLPFGQSFSSTRKFSRNSWTIDDHSRLLGSSPGTPGPRKTILVYWEVLQELLGHGRPFSFTGKFSRNSWATDELLGHERSFSSTESFPGTPEPPTELLGHRRSFSSTRKFSRNSWATDDPSCLLGDSLGTPGPRTTIHAYWEIHK
ncbi:hypothetical protein V8G54_013445 [Vigna mungo]|uniref:Retrotransposon gag domain-containing protein n=1 Tax=Vigna mungo TaxID=3915 RepID=A0AAQ3S1I7_VIGMU